MAAGTDNRQAVFSWLNTFLKDQGLQFSQSGFKNGNSIGNHVVDVTTGYWGNPQYSGSKPPRFLVNVDVRNAPPTANLPFGLNEIGVGYSNTGAGDKAGLAVRILPLLQTDNGVFVRVDEFETNLLFVFHGALQAGGSADSFAFEPATGQLIRTSKKIGKKAEGYIFAGLIGLRERNETVEVDLAGAAKQITYGEVIDAMAAAIAVQPIGAAAGPAPTYDLTDDNQAGQLTVDIKDAWDAAGPPAVVLVAGAEDEAEDDDLEPLDLSMIEIPENPELLGIDPAVYRQINAVLRSGKQHVML